jgi:hypothetical protein
MSKRLAKCKSFNGKFFVKQLRQHPPFQSSTQSLNNNNNTDQRQFTKDSAIRYAQNLLDANYILPTFHSLPHQQHKINSEKRQTNVSDRKTKNAVTRTGSQRSRADTEVSLTSAASMLTTFISDLNKTNSSSHVVATNSHKEVAQNSGEDDFDGEQEEREENSDYCIYLATKQSHYRLNVPDIDKLTENLLFKNRILNQELEILFPSSVNTYYEAMSSALFDECLEKSENNEAAAASGAGEKRQDSDHRSSFDSVYSVSTSTTSRGGVSMNEQPVGNHAASLPHIDQELVMRILWHRVYSAGGGAEAQLVMRFISIRQSNYMSQNQNMSKAQRLSQLFYNVVVTPAAFPQSTTTTTSNKTTTLAQSFPTPFP